MKRTFRFAQYECIATFLSHATAHADSGFPAGCAEGLSIDAASSPDARYPAFSSAPLYLALLRACALDGTVTPVRISAPVSYLIGLDETTRFDRSVPDGPGFAVAAPVAPGHPHLTAIP